MNIQATIEGRSPLLCNRYLDSAAGNGTSAAIKTGAKGTPREQAAPKLYTDADGKPGVPGANVFAALISAGKFIKAGRKTLTTAKSSLVPAGLLVTELFCPLRPVQWEVDSRSVVIPATGGRIMCHRPRFDKWSLSFTIELDETLFAPEVARQLADEAGKKVGLGDFRPERRGPFGRFNVTQWKPA